MLDSGTVVMAETLVIGYGWMQLAVALTVPRGRVDAGSAETDDMAYRTETNNYKKRLE